MLRAALIGFPSSGRSSLFQLMTSARDTPRGKGYMSFFTVGEDECRAWSIARGTMAACREHGEVRLEGKEYVVQDGDIINFRHAT